MSGTGAQADEPVRRTRGEGRNGVAGEIDMRVDSGREVEPGEERGLGAQRDMP